MATRGAKPKPPRLRIVDGTVNVTRHGSEADLRKKADVSLAAFGRLTQPKHLKGEAGQAWKRYITPAAWLDGSKEPAAIAFCELWQEFREAPQRFVAAKHGQMRAYMSELGLTDERNRGDDGKEDEPDEFFGDN
jgi:phage terminase small subunit